MNQFQWQSDGIFPDSSWKLTTRRQLISEGYFNFRQPSGPRYTTTINSLPYEVLVNIFVKGCEDEDYSWHKPFYRKMKIFPKLARNVCGKWRVLLDRRSKFNLAHFWICKLRLDTRPHYGETVFQLTEFRKQSGASNNCDIHISLDFSVGKSALMFLKARQFLHGLYWIVPYQHQITEIELFCDQVDIWKQLMWILMIKLQFTPRLVHIDMTTSVWRSKAPSPSDIENAPFALGFEPFPWQNHYHPFSFAHFHNLDTWEISECAWLENEIHLPCTISHLRITNSVDADTLLRIFESRRVLSLNLVSLEVYERPPSTPIRSADINSHRTQETRMVPSITFPRLKLLLVNMSVDSTAHFMKQIQCPALEELDNLYRIENEEESDELPISSESSIISFAHHPPRRYLADLYTTLPWSWKTLSILQFVLSNYQAAFLCFLEGENADLQVFHNYEETLRFFYVFDHLLHYSISPRVLRINMGYFQLIRVLKVIDKSQLRELVVEYEPVEVYDSATNELEEMERIWETSREQTIDSVVLLPALEHLDIYFRSRLSRPYAQLPHLLHTLQAPVLQTFKVNVTYPEEISTISNTATTTVDPPFLVVHKIICTFYSLIFSSYLIRYLWNMTPNAKHLDICFEVDLVGSQAIRSNIFRSVKLVCSHLGPQVDSMPMLRQLAYLKVTVSFSAFIFRDISREEIREIRRDIWFMLMGVFIDRERTGSSPLALLDSVDYPKKCLPIDEESRKINFFAQTLTNPWRPHYF